MKLFLPGSSLTCIGKRAPHSCEEQLENRTPVLAGIDVQDSNESKNRCAPFVGLPWLLWGISDTDWHCQRCTPLGAGGQWGSGLHNCEHCNFSLLMSSVSPVCIFISAMLAGAPAAVSDCVEEQGSFLTSLNPQSGKTIGMLHVADVMTLAKSDTGAHSQSCHTGIHFCSINWTRKSTSRGWPVCFERFLGKEAKAGSRFACEGWTSGEQVMGLV